MIGDKDSSGTQKNDEMIIGKNIAGRLSCGCVITFDEYALGPLNPRLLEPF